MAALNYADIHILIPLNRNVHPIVKLLSLSSGISLHWHHGPSSQITHTNDICLEPHIVARLYISAPRNILSFARVHSLLVLANLKAYAHIIHRRFLNES
jgi:hypothetical protein